MRAAAVASLQEDSVSLATSCQAVEVGSTRVTGESDGFVELSCIISTSFYICRQLHLFDSRVAVLVQVQNCFSALVSIAVADLACCTLYVTGVSQFSLILQQLSTMAENSNVVFVKVDVDDASVSVFIIL